MEFKSLPQFTKSIEDRTVTGIFAVHGNVDSGGDRSWPGTFANIAMNGRDRAKFLWQHDGQSPPTAVITGIRELSRAELPTSVLGFAPDATGGAEVTRTYLPTPRGDEILTGLKSGAIEEMSYGYDVTRYDFEETDEKTIRNIREVKLYDISDVNWGMNDATTGIKGWPLEGAPLHTYADQAEACLSQFTKEARLLEGRRAKEGRVLSDANRKRISSLQEALTAVLADLDELLTATAPKDTGKVNALYLEFQRIEAQLNGALPWEN
jgi:HK97 family phage prohead protease